MKTVQLKYLSSFLLLALCVSFSIPEPVNSQRLTDRNLILNPLANPNVDIADEEVRWFTQVGGWAEFGNYGVKSDFHHSWYQELGAYFEIYRRGNRSSLAVTSQIEFIADPDNDIRFSPRSIFWEEGILYTSNRGGFFLQTGYYHRCKHDIDNLERGTERVPVYGSVMARVIVPFSINREKDALFSLKYDHYTITWERRLPREYEEINPNWEKLRLSITSNLTWQVPLGDNSNLHLGGYGMATLFDDAGFRGNGELRAEIGNSSRAGDIRFGIHLEHLLDSGITVRPSSVTLIGVGLRVMSKGSVR